MHACQIWGRSWSELSHRLHKSVSVLCSSTWWLTESKCIEIWPEKPRDFPIWYQNDSSVCLGALHTVSLNVVIIPESRAGEGEEGGGWGGVWSHWHTFIIEWLAVMHHEPRMSSCDLIWVRLAQNGTNLGLFKISFSTFWLGEPKCTETDLNKPQICPIWG